MVLYYYPILLTWYKLCKFLDFHKIGGFMILKPCLNCKNDKIRSATCGLIAELCQNNPYCQNIIIDNDFVQILLHILDKDESDIVGIKCLYALSGTLIFRINRKGFIYIF